MIIKTKNVHVFQGDEPLLGRGNILSAQTVTICQFLEEDGDGAA